MTDAVEHIFQPRPVAIGAVAEIDENADDGVSDFGRVRRLDDDVGISGEILMSGNAANTEPEPDARLGLETVLHFHGSKGDVVGLFQHCDRAAAVEGNIELAR